MATYTSKGMGFAIDNVGGTLTDISAYTDSVEMSNTIEQLDDTGLGDTTRSYIDGLGDAPTVTASGALNSTTEPIFSALAVTGTSVSNVKTIEVKLAAGVYWTGEATSESATSGGSVGERGAWSVTCRPTTSLTSTAASGD